jgi:single-strand DNA-binding protein
VNVTLLIGRMTRDPEVRYVAAGHPMAQFTLAVARDVVNGTGEQETDFIAVVAWRRLAEQVGEHGRRGRLVGIQGRLQTRTYETADGVRRRITEVIASQVRFLDRPPQSQNEPANPPHDPAPERVPLSP